MGLPEAAEWPPGPSRHCVGALQAPTANPVIFMKIQINENGQRPQIVDDTFLDARNGRFPSSTRVCIDQTDGFDHSECRGEPLKVEAKPYFPHSGQPLQWGRSTVAA